MRHHAVFCAYKRNGRVEVLTLEPKGGGTPVVLHPGMNAVDAKAWAAIVSAPDARTKQLLEDKAIEDKGLAPEDPGLAEAEDPTPSAPANVKH